MKKISQEDMDAILYRVDHEGMDYCFTEYSDWTEETEGTVLAPLIKKYRKAHDELAEMLRILREEYEIEDL